MRGQTLNRISKILLIGAVSAATVVGIYALDAKRQSSNQIALSLRWTRQMVTQTESLSLSAAARGERDSLTWAARLLSEGTDSRIIFAAKAQVPTPVVEPETYFLDANTGIFDYTKIFDFLQGTGIRIRLYTTRTGLFGARTQLQNDITVAILFFMIFGLLNFRFGPRKTEDSAENQTSAEPPLMPLVLAWVGDTKKSLVDLGTHIRELIGSARNLTLASRESKDLVGGLRLKLHQQISVLHETRKAIPALSSLAEEVEAALSGGKSVDAKTQKLLKKMLSTLIQQAETITSVEVELEPLATDADLAFNSLENVDAEAAALSAEIKHTTQGMLDQSRRVGALTEIRDSTKCQADVAANRAVRSS
jgi:hypothetical protein